MRNGFRVVVSVSSLLALAGCGNQGLAPTEMEMLESGAAQAVLTSGALMVPPLVIVLSVEEGARQNAAAAHNAVLDARCATIPIAAELNGQRPNGTGCVRPSAPVGAWGPVQ